MSTPITMAALSQIEAGKTRPGEQTIADLAAALEVPVGFFSTGWLNDDDGDSPVTYFRDLRGTPARERRRATALAVVLNDLMTAIEVHARFPELRVPAYPMTPDATSPEIEAVAERVRVEWQLGTDPIPHVVRELERHGVPVTRLTVGHQSVDAFSVLFDRRPIVLLSENKSNYVRSRFDAAHELGHLVMHRDAEPGSRPTENQAHDFASSFLLPGSVAVRELPTKLDAAGWTRLAQLKRHWGISIAALLFRARTLEVLGLGAYRNAMRYMSARGWRTIEPGDREMGPPEAPLLFERGLRAVEVQVGQSVEELATWANLPLADTLELVHAGVDNRPTVEL
jgi:Zn-dependent peptidase ImmA (M78 family)/transcriptional regulator with XRE-family HTH domain